MAFSLIVHGLAMVIFIRTFSGGLAILSLTPYCIHWYHGRITIGG